MLTTLTALLLTSTPALAQGTPVERDDAQDAAAWIQGRPTRPSDLTAEQTRQWEIADEHHDAAARKAPWAAGWWVVGGVGAVAAAASPGLGVGEVVTVAGVGGGLATSHAVRRHRRLASDSQLALTGPTIGRSEFVRPGVPGGVQMTAEDDAAWRRAGWKRVGGATQIALGAPVVGVGVLTVGLSAVLCCDDGLIGVSSSAAATGVAVGGGLTLAGGALIASGGHSMRRAERERAQIGRRYWAGVRRGRTLRFARVAGVTPVAQRQGMGLALNGTF